MAKQIKFTDNSVFVGYDYEIVDSLNGYSGVFPHAAIVVKAGSYTTPNFTKTDLDGHIWTWNGSTLTISGINKTFNVPDYGVVFMNPTGINYSKRGINSFSGFNNYYTNTHQWRGTQGVANGVSIGSFISQYQNYYSCYDLYIDGSVHIEIKRDSTHTYYSTLWDGWGGNQFDMDSLFPNSYQDYVPSPENNDPYSPGGTSTTGGGGGDFNNSSDTIDVPMYDATQSLARQYANRGFTRVYTPTEAQVTSLHNYLWSSSIDTTLKKMFSSPMQSIVSLAMLPVTLDSQLKTSENIHLGGVDTEIQCTKYPYQFVEVDCGSLTIPLYWRSYLDYSPHTKLQIYLPYIGMQAISIDDFIDATMGVKYIVDIVSGDCVCFVSRTNVQMLPVYNDEQPDDNGVIYTFTGNCALKVPVSAADYSSAYAAGLSAISAGVGLGLSAMTGGLTAPAAVGGIMATATNVSAAKERVQRGGSIPSTLGWMGIQTPYLIITRPIQCVPDEQYKYTGYPAYVTRKVSECVGYAEFEEIHLEGVPATDSELVEIENMLKQGVIINV